MLQHSVNKHDQTTSVRPVAQRKQLTIDSIVKWMPRAKNTSYWSDRWDIAHDNLELIILYHKSFIPVKLFITAILVAMNIGRT